MILAFLSGITALAASQLALMGEEGPSPPPPPALLNADGPSQGEAYAWRPVAIGGGGFVTGFAFSRDGRTRLVRTDVYGAYRWDAVADRWRQLITAEAMPPEDRRPDTLNSGVYEIAVAPGDAARAYMAIQGKLYWSADGGIHWQRGDAPPLSFDANAEGRFAGPYMAVSPDDPLQVFFGSPSDGLWRSTDGGRHWRRVWAPRSAGNAAAMGIGVWFGPDGSKGQRSLYAAVPGGGLFRASGEVRGDALSFEPAGSGTAPRSIWRAAFFADGSMLAVDRDAQGAFLLSGGKWRSYTAEGVIPALRFVGAAIGADGKRALVIDEGGRAFCSLGPGRPWRELTTGAAPGAGEPPWLRAADEGYFATGSITFDPVRPDRLWNAAGTGPWFADLGAGCERIGWTSQVRGIEELVAMDVIQPPGKAPLFAALDFGIHVKADLNRFSATYGPAERVLIAAQQLAWTPAAPDFIATNASDTRTGCCWQDGRSVLAGYSENGGRGWRRFPLLPSPPGTRMLDPWRMAFGTIAVAADTPGNIVWLPGYNRAPYYTKNRGLTWSRVVFPGEKLPETGSFSSIWQQRKTLAADRVEPGTFYLVHSGTPANPQLAGLWRTTDGGEHWQRRFTGEIAPNSNQAAKLRAVPGHGGHLFFTTGLQGGRDIALRRSFDGGAHWVALPDVSAVDDIAFGKAAKGRDYPALYISGRFRGVYGIWRSVDDALTWQRLIDFPLGRLDQVTVMEADKQVFGRLYLGYKGSGWIYGEPADCARLPAIAGDSACRPVDAAGARQ